MTFLTPEEVRDASLNAFGRDLTEVADTLAVTGAIDQAEARVQDDLGRHLFVQPHTIYPGETHVGPWAWSHGRNAWALWAPEWPVVQVDEEGATFVAKRIYLEEKVDELTFYAGYRLAGQELDDLNELDGLEELEELPPVLPADVRGAMIDLSLLYLRPRVEGTLGSGKKIQQIGQSVVTVEAVDAGAEGRILRRIRRHRRAI